LRAAQYVGRVVTVEEPIAGGRGKVRVGDTVWSAQGSDAPLGARVRVTGTNGCVLLVEHAAS
jgi:membrane protein implicated in regulation of membrane protease activity